MKKGGEKRVEQGGKEGRNDRKKGGKWVKKGKKEKM